MSRFIGEIPDEFLEKSGRNLYEDTREYGGSWRDSTYQTFGSQREYGANGTSFSRPGRDAQARKRPSFGASTIGGRSGKGGNIAFQKGEMVMHDAFGKGMVISITPMGGDALMEIAFDNVGTKRLMYKSASAHLKKD